MKLLSPRKHYVAVECQDLHREFLQEQQCSYLLGLPMAGMNHSFCKSMWQSILHQGVQNGLHALARFAIEIVLEEQIDLELVRCQ